MKRANNIYSQITIQEIIYIYNSQIRVNTKNKVKVRRFEDFYGLNIANVFNLIESKTYIPGKYNIFLIREPKYRIVMSQNMTDKLVNHVIANRLINILEPSFINTNVATRKNKGTHYGIKYLKKYLNEAKVNGTIYALKFDVSKYFYSIDHQVLKELLVKEIKDSDFLDILYCIIDSTNSGINETISKIIDDEKKRINLKNNCVSEFDRIPFYNEGKGLPIGNMTSQIMAIFYLNDIDHFIKENLHIKYYIRYMDDGILLSNNKNYLIYCLNEINKLMAKYKLKLNSKTKIYNVNKEGIDFLGFHFYLKNNKIYMKVRNITKKRFRKKMKKIKLNKYDETTSLQIINSYKAHFKWGNCYRLFNYHI